MDKNILITGGAGFIGSHVVRHFTKQYPQYRIVNLDALTYAGRQSNVGDAQSAPNYVFVHADVADTETVQTVFKRYQIDAVIHLAAQTHVDRSVEDPLSFVRTNVHGTAVLLQTARMYWQNTPANRFYQISTDEVYGSLGAKGAFQEHSPLRPRSPYSASKASADHLVNAYANTYSLPTVISRCSNNYGPLQFPEKLIPLVLTRIIKQQTIPIYGDGKNVRDWLWVGDHVQAIDLIFHRGRIGQTYNIGAEQEKTNVELVHTLCAIADRKLGRTPGSSKTLIRFVEDRLGHDFRYAIDSTTLRTELGWQPQCTFEQGLEKTVDWYLANPDLTA